MAAPPERMAGLSASAIQEQMTAMTASFLLALAALPGTPMAPSVTEVPVLTQDAAPVEERIAACGEDTAKLWELAQALKAESKYADARKAMEKIVELDPEHAEARAGLGHQKYGGKWFKSSVELMMFRRKEEQEMREKGLVRVGDEWVAEADAPYLRMGWVKGEGGAWQNPLDVARLEQEAKYRADGWQQQDLTWIPPDEFGEWDKGKFKCGDEWLDPEQADAYHSAIGRWWTSPSENNHYVVIGTVSRNGIDWARFWVEQTYPKLVEVYGKEPKEPMPLLLLNSLDQYNTIASGDPNNGIPAAEATGLSSVHYAFFAESFFDGTTQPPTYRGCGTAYWDEQNGWAWGQYAIRHAAALSYAEAIDPSWNAISQAISNPTGGFQQDAFWNEKKIPNWVRFGTASYVERFAPMELSDEQKEADADPLANRKWALGELQKAGGMRPLQDVLAFRRDVNDPTMGALIHEAGAVMCWVLDGDNAAVRAAHAAWKKALASGKGVAEATEALNAAVLANEADLREFTGLTIGAKAAEASATTATGSK